MSDQQDVEVGQIPQEVLIELPQILSNLIAADNQIRQDAEKAVNDRLANAPEAYLLALASFARSSESEVMRTFSLVLLRRLLFRQLPTLGQPPLSPANANSPSPSPSSQSHSRPPSAAGHNTLYDHLGENTRTALERLVLRCLTHEEKESVRKKCADTVSDIALGSFERGRDWEGVRIWIGDACGRGGLAMRESAYTILGNVPTLLHDIPIDTLLPLLQSGLHLSTSPSSSLATSSGSSSTQQLSSSPSPLELSTAHAALTATCAFLRTTHDPAILGHAGVPLIISSLSLLPLLPLAELPRFLSTMTSTPTGSGFVISQPTLVGAHLADLLGFFAPRVVGEEREDEELMKTARPLEGRMGGGMRAGGELETPTTSGRGVFTFPPVSSGGGGGGTDGGGGRNKNAGGSRTKKSSSGDPSSSSSPSSPSPSPSEKWDSDNDSEGDDDDPDLAALKESRHLARLAILEFMLTLTEVKPSLIRKAGDLGSAWIRAIVRGCLEGLSEISGKTSEWLRAVPGPGAGDSGGASGPAGSGGGGDDDGGMGTGTSVFEQALDRLSVALSTSNPSVTNPTANPAQAQPGGQTWGTSQPQQSLSVLSTAFAYIPAMLVSSSWKVRHAGLMGIACLAEGGRREMGKESGRVVGLVLPMFGDGHPRVRWAACQCIGQLCTDLEELIQEEYYDQIIKVLIPALEAPEARVHQYAAAALINFCETVSSSTLTPYLSSLLPRLLRLLQTSPHAYVQEQAITSLAMVADASEAAFTPYYYQIMPLLLGVLSVEDGPELGWLATAGGRRLRCKAMECCGLVAIAVGYDVFRNDSARMAELLTGIQNKASRVDDSELNHYLIATWAKLCQAMGPEFEPYAPIVMPPLLHSASLKADVSVVEDSEPDSSTQQDGWETMDMNGQQIGIKTSVIEEKCQAFDMLVIHISTLGPRFAPYLHHTLQLVLPNLRFFFHDGVRESCALLIPMLVSCAKESKLLTEEMFEAIFTQLINVIGTEPDASFLASLYKCFADSARLFIHPSPQGSHQPRHQFAFPPQYTQSLFKATQSQLQIIAQKRKQRGSLPEYQRDELHDELALLEEMEEYALEDIGKCIALLDPSSHLLIAVGSVRELAIFGTPEDWPEE